MVGERIQRARNAKNLSLRALGDLVEVSQTTISKYEKNQAVPNSTMLLKIAKAVGVKTEYFFRTKEIKLEKVEYRKREISNIKLQVIESKIHDLIERRFELEDLFPGEVFPEFEIPNELFSSDFKIQYYKDIDEYADRLRKLWDIGLDAISDFSTLLEEKGIRVFMINENADKNFDGLAAIVNKSPIIVLSKNLPGDRQRFTLAHELGHLLFDGKIGHGLDEEKVCNRFAGAFLLPSVAVKKALGDKRKNIEIAELGLIKSEYGASMQSAIMRANQAGVISYDYSSSLWRKFKKNDWLEIEPGEQYPSEKIYTFKHLVLRALAKDYIGESKAAEFLGMSVNKFHKYRMENKV